MSDKLPDEYDDWTVEDVRSFVRDVDDPTVLDALTLYEGQNKDRKTVHEAVEDRRESLDDEPLEAETEEIEADTEEESGDDHATPGERFSQLRVKAPGGGHVAGFSFEPGEVKHVPETETVKQALRNGKLQRVA